MAPLLTRRPTTAEPDDVVPFVLPLVERARSIALVGTYPPTACGLATFTSNLRAAITVGAPGWVAPVVRVLDRPEPELSEEVAAQWIAGDATSLRRALAAVASSDAVVLQHEYGLFAGVDGEEVLALVDALGPPLVAVLHTVLLEPSVHQRQTLDRVLAAAAAVVVQSETARRRLVAAHGVAPEGVIVVPHGAAENFAGPIPLSVAGPTVLTWGLLSRGKGIEHGIAALARLGADTPAPRYIVAGQTHPKVQAIEGERYRRGLQAQARRLGVSDRVDFDGTYRDWSSLRELVRSVDVVLLPYDSHDQVSSGVLVEALASGKPVVATRFPHAEELLASGAGILVEHGDAEAMARALARVLSEPGLAEEMSAAARRTAEPMLWPAVGRAYRALVERVIADRAVA